MTSILTALTPPPDLLRRFVETPFHSRLQLQGVCVLVASNEASLISALSRWAAPPEDAGHEDASGEIVCWKLICDPDAGPPSMEANITDSGTVITAWFGQGNMLAMDWDCGEAYAFIAPGCEQFCAQVMVPLLARWIEKRCLWQNLIRWTEEDACA
jgi:hypothetical protein